MKKETAKKLQEIRLKMVALKIELKEIGCDIDDQIEPALQTIMKKEDEYHVNVESCWDIMGATGRRVNNEH